MKSQKLNCQKLLALDAPVGGGDYLKVFISAFILTFLILPLFFLTFAQEQADDPGASLPAESQPAEPPQAASELPTAHDDSVVLTDEAAQVAAKKAKNDEELVTLDFNEADINNVLKIISYKAGINIVTTPDVMGTVTIRLVDVPWEKALAVILRTNGYAYERQDTIITVAPVEQLTAQKRQDAELAQIQPLTTEVFNLKFIDAQDAKKALVSQMSARGKITVLEMTGQTGWEFANDAKVKRAKVVKGDKSALGGRSRILIISEIPPVLEKIRKVIDQIDQKGKQVIIETKIMEISRDKLKDMGFDWQTVGTDGTASAVIKKSNYGQATQTLGAQSLSSDVNPAVFAPKAVDISGVYPFNTGLSLLFRKLDGMQLEGMIHALQEDVHTNVLSCPRIMALNNQEATIFIGSQYPILETSVAGTDSTTTTVTLDHYENIGIQLNVVAQIGANDYVNMVVHPAVTSYTLTVGDNKYPIIETREAETRVVMKDGETVVIGGLLKDVKSTSKAGIPILKDIPWVGNLFGRDSTDTEKVELLIFITARVVKDTDFSPEAIAQLEDYFKEDRKAVNEPKSKRK